MDRVLIAEDSATYRRALAATITKLGFEVVTVADGTAALELLQRPDGPGLAVLDWEMPGTCGAEVCARLRARPAARPLYLLLLTAREATEDLVAGLRSGANDYLTKPFRPAELEARLGVAVRTLELQRNLAERVNELEQALAQIRQLRGLLPICAWCRKVRDDQNYWQQIDEFLCEHAGVQVTHGICPDCLAREEAKVV